MIFLCFLLILSAFLMYLSLLYLVNVSQMAIFVETEVIILLFMGVVTFHVGLCCT